MSRTTVYTGGGSRLLIEKEVGRGGEGSVHSLKDDDKHVVKLAHNPLGAEQSAKIVEMVRQQTDRLKRLTAWPVETVHDTQGGSVIGFLMPKVTGRAIHTLYGPKSRMAHFPQADWRFLIHVAGNIARAVQSIHEHQIVIGDINHGNIFVAPDGIVTLLDADSFQIQAGSRLLLCGVGIETHTPPELQGVNFRVTPRTPNHDNFGLAVLIFQLLFLGRHPFAGRYLNGEPSLGDAIKQRLFAYGSDAKNRGVVAPPSTLELEASTAFIAQLFKRAFLTDGAMKAFATARPLPSEWLHGLEALKQSLKVCVLHGGHYYAGQLKDCPWCEIELQSKVQLFPFSASQVQRSSFDIEAFWKQVLKVPILPPLGVLELKPLPIVNISLWAEEQKKLYSTGMKSLLSKMGMSKERRQAQEVAKMKVRATEKAWQNLQSQWRDGWGILASRLRNDLETLKAQYSDIEPQRQRRLNQLQKDQNQSQLQRHLDSHRIENARISGLGPARK